MYIALHMQTGFVAGDTAYFGSKHHCMLNGELRSVGQAVREKRECKDSWLEALGACILIPKVDWPYPENTFVWHNPVTANGDDGDCMTHVDDLRLSVTYPVQLRDDTPANALRILKRGTSRYCTRALVAHTDVLESNNIAAEVHVVIPTPKVWFVPDDVDHSPLSRGSKSLDNLALHCARTGSWNIPGVPRLGEMAAWVQSVGQDVHVTLPNGKKEVYSLDKQKLAETYAYTAIEPTLVPVVASGRLSAYSTLFAPVEVGTWRKDALRQENWPWVQLAAALSQQDDGCYDARYNCIHEGQCLADFTDTPTAGVLTNLPWLSLVHNAPGLSVDMYYSYHLRGKLQFRNV